MIGQNFELQRQRMNATGIGLAGIDGVWWLPAAEPFILPAQAARDLAEIGQAIFALFDAVTSLYGTPAGAAGGLDDLLRYKVPPNISRLVSQGRVESVRPDFQLVLQTSPVSKTLEISFVATELEICPSAHGYAQAMQTGYGLPLDLVESFAHYLNGRELLFVGTQQWSEFLFEQLAFCRALAEVGSWARVLYDLPVRVMADQIRQGQRWQPPIFGIKQKPPAWNNNLLERIEAHRFEPFLWPDEAGWPEAVGNAVLFRFGYVDCFAPDKLRYFERWRRQGAAVLNPATFFLDSKAVMAALNLPLVREQIARSNLKALAVLDRCIPETLLLRQETRQRLVAEKDAWVVKYAGFDGGNQAWGGRSLQLGLNHSAASWREVLAQALEVPWPVVAQRLVPSARVDIAYVDNRGEAQVMEQGDTRLRTFFLRDGAAAVACGSHLTVAGGTMQVSEATDTVQAPILFRD
ncbi:MAG: hypothetical protein BroJett011_69310 [Chloroflexota bacterium]|nr:MAG: hypothetical protein BroJett011_69310 [Chloroflexota bacterium]